MTITLLISMIMCAINYPLFLISFLQPKFSTRTTWLLSGASILLINLPGKFIQMTVNLPIHTLLFSLLISSILFYRANLSYKLSAVFILMSSTLFSVIISLLLTNFNHYLIILIPIINYLLIITILKYITALIIPDQRYRKLLLMIWCQSFLITNCIYQTYSGLPFQNNLYYIIVNVTICLFISIYLVYACSNLSKDIIHQSIIQELYEEYNNQLISYLKTKEDIKRLRHLKHDIINYLQTISTCSKEDNNE